MGATDVAAFLSEHPSVQYVDCVFVDLCGNVRGKRIPAAELASVFRSGIQVPPSIYFLDARGDVVEQLSASAGSTGTAWPVAGSLTSVSWAQRPHGQVLMSLSDGKGERYFGEPRNVLQRVLRRFEEFDAVPEIGMAIDAYLVERERGKDGAPLPLTVARAEKNKSVSSEIVAAAAAQKLPALSVTGTPAHITIAFPAQGDAVAAADHVVFLRQVVRAVARKEGCDALFMARPFLAHPGNGMRVTVDVKRDGQSVLQSDSSGDLARFAVGGLQALMVESLALVAPSVNAFRRFGGKNAVPRNRRWGYGNATVNLSIEARGGSVAVEHRLTAADANPYLAIASVLAGIHYGIAQNADPGQPVNGDAGGFIDPTLPTNVDGALLALENGSVMREYLGPSYVDLYCATKRAEIERFCDVIPVHEYDWYA